MEEFKRRLAIAELPIYSPALEKKRAKVRRRLRVLFGTIGAIVLSGIYESSALSPKVESGGATPQRSVQLDGVVYGSRALADRGLALVEAIGRDFGQIPHALSFTGKDTIDVTFWNPSFWRSDVRSKEFPQASLPLVRKAAEQVGGYGAAGRRRTPLLARFPSTSVCHSRVVAPFALCTKSISTLESYRSRRRRQPERPRAARPPKCGKCDGH